MSGSPVGAANVRRRAAQPHHRHRQLGQSLVEFALVAPVMLLLALIALDFGRVYLGWINLQNMARTATNYAANNAEKMFLNDPTTVAAYRNQVINDAAATNCKLVTTDPNDPATVPPPVFTDGNGNGSGTDIGDRATASFTCRFGLITPIISHILGNTLNVSASAMFPVKSGQFQTSSSGGPVASFTGAPTTTTTGTAVSFTDTSTGTPTSWTWTFGDGATVSGTATPTHAYSAAGLYTVALTVGNASGISTFTRTDYITVTSSAPVADFTADTTTPTTGTTVHFTATSTGTPTNYAWTFGDGGSISGATATASHAYNTAGTYTVKLVVTAASGTTTVTKTNYIVVSTPTCKVPSFIGTSSGSAQATWTAASFTTTVKFKQGNLPWTIQSQDVVANSNAPCNTVITVSKN